ncbi:MAG: hypothetical protein KAH86_00035 [Methanosarcinales archaeon]|nr:hypothetical protein [Methanosarcinales archaeon]
MKERDKIHKKLTDKFDELFDVMGKKWDPEDKADAKTDRLKKEEGVKKIEDNLNDVLNDLYSKKIKVEQTRKQKIVNIESVNDAEIIKKLAQTFSEDGDDGEAEIIEKIEAIVNAEDSAKPYGKEDIIAVDKEPEHASGKVELPHEEELHKTDKETYEEEPGEYTVSESDRATTQSIEPTAIRTGNRSVGVVHYKNHILHKPEAVGLAADSPENPQRITRIMDFLRSNKMFDSPDCDLLETFDKASEEDILAVHTLEHLNFVKSYSSKGGGFLGNSTYMCKESYDAALYAAGGAIFAGKLIAEHEYQYAMSLIRPPGHHASADKYGGFCIFNNAAVLARHMQRNGFRKVMIIDWDVHAGNGTMDIFYHDPTVFTLSIHQDPHDYYPKTGFTEQTGEGAGKGYTLNIEMPEGAGDDEYAIVIERVVIPAIKKFAPDFIIGLCGLDAHYKDTHSNINMTSTGYYNIVSTLTDSISCPFVILLEGGYHEFNNRIVHSVISALIGKPDPHHDSLDLLGYEVRKQKAIFKETEKRIEAVKNIADVN